MLYHPLRCATVLLATQLVHASQDKGNGQYLHVRQFSNSTTSHPEITPPPTPPTLRPTPPPTKIDPSCSTCSEDTSSDTAQGTSSGKDTSPCYSSGNATACPNTSETVYVSNITIATSINTGNCSGSITYLDSIPSFTTSTYTETNSTLTLYGSNTVYTPAAVVYPPPFCEVFAVAATSICFPNRCPSETFLSSALSIGNEPFVSTVIVTKKSPVIVIASITPPPSFGITPAPPPAAQTGGGSSDGKSAGGGGKNDQGTKGNPGGNNSGGNNSGGNNSGANKSGGNNSGGNNSGGNNSGGGGGGLGSVIASVFNNPFVPKSTPQPGSGSSGTGGGSQPVVGGGAQPGGSGGAQPGGGGGSGTGSGPGSQLVVTNVNGVPLIVGPGGVIIGAQVISPSNGPTIVTVNGQVFTISPSQVIAPGTIIPIPVAAGTSSETAGGTSVVATAAPESMSTMIVGGMALTIGRQEVVISGHTYAIGPDATPVTMRINGQVLTVGPAGVIFPSTTVAPEGAVVQPTFSVATVGGLTFSVDASEAVISGTTYSVGAGSTPKTTIIGGQTIIVGPGGVGLASTTISALPSSTEGLSFTGGGEKRSSSWASIWAVALGSLIWV